MIQVEHRSARSGENSAPLYAWISTDIVEIRKGMKLSYDVRIDPGSMSDRVALILDLDLPAGAPSPQIHDQNGIPIGRLETGRASRTCPAWGKGLGENGITGSSTCPVLRAAGWSGSDCMRPCPRPWAPEGTLKFYLDNIHFTWPEREP